MHNMEIWDQVCETDPNSTKAGRKFGNRTMTAIDAQIQRKTATQVFGPYGNGWGITDQKYELVHLKEDEVQCVFEGTLAYTYVDGDGKPHQGSLPIVSTTTVITRDKYGKLRISDEWLKIAQTDALTKGLSQLGFNSDVFEGKFDDNKYVESLRTKVNSKGDRDQGQPDPGTPDPTAVEVREAPPAAIPEPESFEPEPPVMSVTNNELDTFGSLLLQAAKNPKLGRNEVERIWKDPENDRLVTAIKLTRPEIITQISEALA